jgi:hypothetical protein
VDPSTTPGPPRFAVGPGATPGGPIDELAAQWDGTDDELAELALAADPDASVAHDAVAWRAPSALSGYLPEWYMPAPTARSRPRGTAVVIALVVVGFLVIDACGLCITSGFLSWA